MPGFIDYPCYICLFRRIPQYKPIFPAVSGKPLRFLCICLLLIQFHILCGCNVQRKPGGMLTRSRKRHGFFCFFICVQRSIPLRKPVCHAAVENLPLLLIIPICRTDIQAHSRTSRIFQHFCRRIQNPGIHITGFHNFRKFRFPSFIQRMGFIDQHQSPVILFRRISIRI